MAIATITLAAFRSIGRAEAIVILIGFVVSLVALFALWRWLDRKGARRRRTVPVFVVVLLVWFVAYPKLVV